MDYKALIVDLLESLPQHSLEYLFYFILEMKKRREL